MVSMVRKNSSIRSGSRTSIKRPPAFPGRASALTPGWARPLARTGEDLTRDDGALLTDEPGDSRQRSEIGFAHLVFAGMDAEFTFYERDHLHDRHGIDHALFE